MNPEENKENNVQEEPVIEQAEEVSIEPTTEAPAEELVIETAAEEPAEELVIEAATDAPAEVDANVQAEQPALQPTVDVPTAEATTEGEEKPHEVSMPSQKKDFIIKSKKETVAEETKLREAKIEEHIRKANENYKPNSKLTNIALTVFLVGIIVFVIFLPQIQEFVGKLTAGQLEKQEGEDEIKDGVLTCTYVKSSESFDFEYTYVFSFSDKKLNDYSRTTITTGDASLDKEKLTELKDNCSIMKKEKIPGIKVTCESSSNSVTVKEDFTLREIKYEDLTPAYTEAGGEYPEYSAGQSIKDTERNMVATGFKCEKTRS